MARQGGLFDRFAVRFLQFPQPRQKQILQILVLIAAPAGYGKSFFVTTFLRHERLHARKWRVAGSSGVAAVNIGGSTLHSLLQMNAQCLTRLDDESIDAAELTEVQGIIIDEYAMVDIKVWGN